MKRYFLLVIWLSFSLLFEAKEVSYDEALSQASAFFAPTSSSKKQMKALKNNLSLATTFNQTLEKHKPAFYIINNGENGFVIVSADDNAKSILGYSKNGAFDANNIPENVQFWLERYAQEISVLAKNDAKKLYATPILYDEIAPLLGDITHDQNYPYNKLCPVISGKQCPVGCVATAAVQIMTKWKYPEKGVGNVSYSYNYYDYSIPKTMNISENLEESTYDWENILPTYQGRYDGTQANAVALLARDVGYATAMKYDPQASGTSDLNLARGWLAHFDYDKSLKKIIYNATYIEKNEAGQVIYNESFLWNPQEDIIAEIYANLKEGRPVFCSAQSADGSGGHAFVCDGMQSDGKLHINWGWKGNCNGYYELTGLKPGAGGTGAGSGIYTKDVSFLVDIQPNKGSIENPLTVGVRNQSYAETTNLFNKSETTARNLLKVTTTDGQDVIYAGGDWVHLGYASITEMGWGYTLCKNDITLYSSAAPWSTESENIEESESFLLHPRYIDGLGIDVTPRGSIAELVQGVNNGVYDLHLAVKDHAVGTLYPVYVWNRGKVRNKIAVGQKKVYIYPASTENYSVYHTPNNLTATQNGDNYTLSWSGDESNYMLLIWDEKNLSVEKVSNNSKEGVNKGKYWAVFACEEANALIYATSHIAYYDGTLENTTEMDDDPDPTDEPETPTNADEVKEGVTISINQLTIEVKSDMQNSIKIYTISGEVLYSVHDSYASFKAPQAGVYIVQVGDKKQKVLVQ